MYVTALCKLGTESSCGSYYSEGSCVHKRGAPFANTRLFHQCCTSRRLEVVSRESSLCWRCPTKHLADFRFTSTNRVHLEDRELTITSKRSSHLLLLFMVFSTKGAGLLPPTSFLDQLPVSLVVIACVLLPVSSSPVSMVYTR